VEGSGLVLVLVLVVDSLNYELREEGEEETKANGSSNI
jgi:hypothetical protein